MAEVAGLIILGIVNLAMLYELRSSRAATIRERSAIAERNRDEREQLLNRIQEPTAAVLQSMKARDNGKGGTPKFESREPTMSQAARRQVAADVDEELRARGVDPESA